MMTLGFTMQIWVPLFTYPTVQAPRFPNCYPASAAFEFGMYAILMFGSWYMVRWKRRQGMQEGGGVSDIETASRSTAEVVVQCEKNAAAASLSSPGTQETSK